MDDHESVITRAISVIKTDGHTTFGKVLDMFASDLIRGTRYADEAGQPVKLDIEIHWTCTTIKTIEFDLGNTSSFSHYYDPYTEHGLDLSTFGSLKAVVEGLTPIIALGILGGIWVDSSTTVPLDFDNPYPSAAALCQEHYERALAVWRGREPSSNPWAEAMFHLGWACHFLADLCVSAHTISSNLSVFLSHNEFEHHIAAFQKKDTGHLTHIPSYQTGDSALKMAIEAATKTREELPLFESHDWDAAAMLAIPRAESYTARLLVKFLQEVNVAAVPLPLRVRVLDHQDGPIPAAFVFYRRPQQDWRWVRTDSEGIVWLTLGAREDFEIRPAAPGYVFKGRHYGTAVPEFSRDAAPVSYTHGTNPLQELSLNFDLEKVAVPQPTVVTVADARLGAGHPDLVTQAIRPVDIAGASPGVDDLGEFRMFDPRIALRAADPVPAAMADQVLMEVIGGDEEATALAVGSPHALAIRVTVFTPLLFPGVLVKSSEEFGDLVRSAPPPGTALRRTEPIDLNARPNDPEVNEALERAPRAGSEGAAATTYSVPFGIRRGIYAQTAAIPVPAGGAYRVRVEVLRGPGLVGSACTPVTAPIEAVTDPYKSLTVRLRTGSEAGLLRLRVTVTREEDQLLLTERFIETVVRPQARGFDTDPPQAPQLELPVIGHIVPINPA